jgi:hypothetical protein
MTDEPRKSPSWEPPHLHIRVDDGFRFAYVKIEPDDKKVCVGFDNEADAKKFHAAIEAHMG